MSEQSAEYYITYILRHDPGVIGIQLDEHGWANVSDLIEGIRRTRPYDFDMEQLEDIVATNNKQRFSFNEDKTLIRANQGHSIKVDVELEKKDPPEILWHGTAEESVDSILEKGLLPMNRLYVHLSPDYDTAVSVGSRHGEPVVFRVAAGEMQKDGYDFYQSVNSVWLTDAVPVKYLQREEERHEQQDHG